jgi:hypothetical protein
MRQRCGGDAAMRRSGCAVVLRRSGIDPEAIGGAAVRRRCGLERRCGAAVRHGTSGAAMARRCSTEVMRLRRCGDAAMLRRCCDAAAVWFCAAQRAASMRQQCGDASTRQRSISSYFHACTHSRKINSTRTIFQTSTNRFQSISTQPISATSSCLQISTPSLNPLSFQTIHHYHYLHTAITVIDYQSKKIHINHILHTNQLTKYLGSKHKGLCKLMSRRPQFYIERSVLFGHILLGYL